MRPRTAGRAASSRAAKSIFFSKSERHHSLVPTFPKIGFTSEDAERGEICFKKRKEKTLFKTNHYQYLQNIISIYFDNNSSSGIKPHSYFDWIPCLQPSQRYRTPISCWRSSTLASDQHRCRPQLPLLHLQSSCNADASP